ncbi:MAG: stage 0 sporulation family protein [Dehalococcoidia bacterium]|nr:stage 0 sporulation family protein [Dehalococcoidia bacterium]MDZ4246986.1 stage 0 sporulation family protein [Dehalococcoidia bacterium]
MPNIIGVRFKKASKIYYFDPGEEDFHVGEAVVVDTTRGTELGWIVIEPKQVLANEIKEPLKPVVRRAGEEDLRKTEEHNKLEKETLARCQEVVAKSRLSMKLISCNHNLEGNRLTIYFSSEGRIDFRDLVKELTSVLQTKVELRQVGPRDEAKHVGGLGRCGRTLCCSTYLCEFAPISIKMAKEQNLPLNPTKISGVCGRLLCCLSYENEQYREMKQEMPRIGQKVQTPSGEGVVYWHNPLKGTVVVELETQAMAEFSVDQLTTEKAVGKSEDKRAK